MIQLKIKEKNQIDQTGKLVYVVDETGEYSLTNLGGYGTPNKERAELALFCLGYLTDSKGGKHVLEPIPYDPITATEFVFKVPTDGRLEFQLVGASIRIADPLDLTLESFIYSDLDFSLLQVVFLGDTETNSFVPVKPEALITSVDSLTSLPYDQLFLANSSLVQIDVNKRIVELLISGESLSNKEKIRVLQEQYDTIRGILEAALYQFCIGNKFEASRFIEFLITNRYAQLQ